MKGKNSYLTASVVYLVLGLVLFLWPGMTTKLFCIAAGALLLLYGAINIVSFFTHSGHTNGLQAELIFGIVSAAVGLFFLIQPRVILSILPIILGLYICIDALVNLKRALDMRNYGYAKWTATLVMALVSLALGLLVLFNPFSTQLLLVRVVGAVFVYQGVSDLISILMLGKLIKENSGE